MRIARYRIGKRWSQTTVAESPISSIGIGLMRDGKTLQCSVGMGLQDKTDVIREGHTIYFSVKEMKQIVDYYKDKV